MKFKAKLGSTCCGGRIKKEKKRGVKTKKKHKSSFLKK